jgi:hypothetical protein
MNHSIGFYHVVHTRIYHFVPADIIMSVRMCGLGCKQANRQPNGRMHSVLQPALDPQCALSKLLPRPELQVS